MIIFPIAQECVIPDSALDPLAYYFITCKCGGDVF